MTEHGTYETIDGRPAVCFERRLAHPVARVWTAITEPADLAQWFPDGFVPDPSAIITSEAPTQLTWTAPDSTPTPEWSGLYEAYQARGFPAGASIPSAG
jgi:hypothetical protein